MWFVGMAIYYGLLFLVTWALVSTDVAEAPLGLGDFTLRDLIVFVAVFIGG